jgi:hypothetical protein
MKLIIQILYWASNWWYPSIRGSKLIIEWWLLKVQLWYSTRGFLWTISHIKALRLHITRYICGHPLMTPQGSFQIRKDGLPKGINPLLDLLKTNEGKSMCLTLLNISRCLPGKKDPDLSTITDPWKGYIPYQMKEFIPEFNKMYGFSKYEVTFTLSDLMNSNKSGPIGQTTQTSVLQADKAMVLEDDLVNLTQGEIIEVVFPNGKTFRPPANIMKPLLKWKGLANDYYDVLSKIFHARPLANRNFLRKLSIVNDPEGKSRIICVFDYWSQTALREIHNWAFKNISKIPCDRTFDQDVFKIKPTGPYYSIDLTAATDRFPLELQYLWLQSLSSEAIAKSWSNILVGQEVYVPWTKSTVKYAAGQPMGAYSSWAIFAICHHLVVQYSAKVAGETVPFNDYMLLGDDIVIANKAVADQYMITLDELGVGVSLYKTHVSENTYEFAKRWISNRVEISGIPLRGLIASCKKYHLMIPILYSLTRHNPARKPANIPDLLSSFNLHIGLNIKHTKAINNRVLEFLAIWKFMKENSSDDLLNLIRMRDTSWFPFPVNGSKSANEYLTWLIERTLVREAFNKNEEVKGFLKQIHKRFNKLFDGDLVNQQPNMKDDLYAAMPYHPSWQSSQAELGRVEENVAAIIKRKDWFELLKIVTLPDPTKLIEDRSNVKLAQGVAKFAKDVFYTADNQRKKDVWFTEQFD